MSMTTTTTATAVTATAAVPKEITEFPCKPFDLKLSHWDIHFPPVHSRRLLCLELAPGSSHEISVARLRQAFASTVESLPYLAGRIVPLRGGAPWLRDIEAQGSAKFIVHDVSAQLPSYSDLKSRGFPQSLLDHQLLCPFEKIVYRQTEPVDVCRVQANLVRGGVLLTVSIINVVSDGRAITETIRTFAENLRSSGSIESIDSRGPQPVYTVDRDAYLNGNGVPGDIDTHPAWSTASKPAYSDPNASVTARHNYRISASNLVSLKEAASSALPQGSWVSTHDAIVALLWRSLIAARYHAGLLPLDDSPTSITQAVDCRQMMGLPKPYHGNAIYAINPSLSTAVLVGKDDPNQSLSAAALAIRQAIQEVTAEKFRDLLAHVERSENETPTTLAVLPHLNKGGIFLTSHFKFDVCGMDFGPIFGKVDACLQPTSSVMPGTPHILSKMSDGSCLIMLNENENVMNHLSKDGSWLRYAVNVD